ncbi:MAG: hypothetical protein ACKVJN_03300, partial [Woeseiales bacterium]
VMALLTVALIAGQARANLPIDIVTAQVPSATTSLGVALNAELLRKLESLPASVNTLLIVPENVRRRPDKRILRKALSSDQAMRRIRQ